jgi:HPt (histidine-containing phosphotransfer) domain-containing protein
MQRSQPVAGAVNRHALLRATDNDVELIVEVTTTFERCVPEYLDAVRLALRDGDAAALSRTAHRLRGALAGIRAQCAERLAQRLESAGASGDLAPAHSILRALESEIAELGRTLPDIRRELLAAR